MKKKRQPMPRFVKVTLLGVAVCCAMSFIHLRIQIHEKKSYLDEINMQISEQQAKNDEIRNQIENGVSDEYIASMAREHGYIEPNERVFKNASSK